jgi:hypothetical protein
MTLATAGVRLTGVLRALGIATSSWYRKAIPEDQRRRPGPPPRSIPEEAIDAVVTMATDNPWYGYQRIAVMCRREDEPVTDRQAYRVMKQHDLLQKRRPYKAEVYQASKLYELLPQRPNELWQMDVTYLHIPGFGWWYAITAIRWFRRKSIARPARSRFLVGKVGPKEPKRSSTRCWSRQPDPRRRRCRCLRVGFSEAWQNK